MAPTGICPIVFIKYFFDLGSHGYITSFPHFSYMLCFMPLVELGSNNKFMV